MAIVIAGTIDVAPERRDSTLRDAVPHIEAALAEPGCIEYAWAADVSRPGRIRLFGEWTCEADLAAHLSGQAYFSMRDHLGTAGIVNAVTQKYRVDHIEPLYDPKGRPRADFFTAKKD
jgi:quinol monooxygenase YgiN